MVLKLGMVGQPPDHPSLFIDDPWVIQKFFKSELKQSYLYLREDDGGYA